MNKSVNKSVILLFTLLAGMSLTAAPSLAETGAKTYTVKKHHKPQTRKHYRKAAAKESSNLVVRSASALVLDQSTGTVLYEKNAGAVLPIASITKLMTAMVTLDEKPNLEEMLSIGEDDVDTLKGTHSRLSVGTQLTREEMLRLALMSSENRAASSLANHYPGGREAFIAAMNHKAQALGLQDTRFSDPTGLTAANVSSARDLVKMVAAAHQYPLIREFTTTTEYAVKIAGRQQAFHNTNSLVKSSAWDIGLSKTGFINEAGKCLVMQAWLNNKPTIIVLLDSLGKLTRIADANRIKRWVEHTALAHATTSNSNSPGRLRLPTAGAGVGVGVGVGVLALRPTAG
ncbi:MAG: D-alanyl-D-alanine endopeptidase [Betaproteobacteria bacterium]|nr:D-alanyl-D-alanine endopeptidase [Betaproteobacteria bacterium]